MLRDNDNEMDALFREGAEHHDFPYNEEAWAMMDAQLDAADRKRRLLWWMMGGLVFLLVSAMTFYTINSNNGLADNTPEVIAESNNTTSIQNTKKELGTSTVSDVKTAETTILKGENKTTKTAGNVANNTEEKPNTKASSVIKMNQTDTKTIAERNVVAEFDVKTQPVYVSTSASSASIQNSEAGSNIEKNTKSFTNSVESIAKVSIPSETSETKNTATVEKRQTEIEPLGLTAKPTLVRANNPIEINDVEIIPTSTTSSRWAVGVYAAPEWSSVGFLGQQKMGYSFGTNLGYQFADKFELSLGVGYSKKVYSGAGKEYTMEEGWYGDIEPMIMDAKCYVIEFPLALRYYANGYKNNGFFADIGISSYMLHTEWYGFEYDEALVRPQSIIEVTENNANKHLVGAGRIAIGYQNVLSDNSTFQVAPYIQFPMTGIGAGQVDLYNMGVQFSLKFNSK